MFYGLFLCFCHFKYLGDCDSKKFLISKEQIYKRQADSIFTLTLFITFFIYLFIYIFLFEIIGSTKEFLVI